MTPNGLRYRAVAATDRGRVRENNEDFVLRETVANANGLYHLWVVADGMGGAARGEVASQTAASFVKTYFDAHPGWFNPIETLRDAVRGANRAVFGIGSGSGEAARSAMGTTLTAVLLHDRSGKFCWANVGDSRLYLDGPRGLEQLTADHSLVAERVRAGLMTGAEARAAANRNVLTRAVGMDADVEPDVSDLRDLAPGEALVLCSDGVHGMLDDRRLAHLLHHPIREDIAERIVAAANEAGGQDNASVLVAALATEIRPATGPAFLASTTPARRQVVFAGAAVGVVLAVAAVVVGAGGFLASGSGAAAGTTVPAIGTAPASLMATREESPNPTSGITASPSALAAHRPSHNEVYAVQESDGTCDSILQKFGYSSDKSAYSWFLTLNPDINIECSNLSSTRPTSSVIVPSVLFLITGGLVQSGERSTLVWDRTNNHLLVDNAVLKGPYEICSVMDDDCLIYGTINIDEISLVNVLDHGVRMCIRLVHDPNNIASITCVKGSK